MGWISVVFVHKAIKAAFAGANPPPGATQPYFLTAGVDPDAPVDPKDMISDTAFFDLLERIAKDFEHGASVPILIGAAMRCDDYGAFGLAFKTAPHLLGSYRRVERFGRVVTSIANFSVVESPGRVRLEVIPGPEKRPGLAMTDQLALAAAMAISREVSLIDPMPKVVHLSAPAPKDDTALRAHFGGNIRHGSDADALEFDLETVLRPNRQADRGMSQFFEAHLDRALGDISDPADLSHRVRSQIGDTLSEGVPTLADVAEALGMSARTLQRRLSDAGLAYQDLVGQARRALAEELLSGTDYALAEIAFLTGFSDQSTFTRAFKRWHGQTPASYRRDN